MKDEIYFYWTIQKEKSLLRFGLYGYSHNRVLLIDALFDPIDLGRSIPDNFSMW